MRLFHTYQSIRKLRYKNIYSYVINYVIHKVSQSLYSTTVLTRNNGGCNYSWEYVSRVWSQTIICNQLLLCAIHVLEYQYMSPYSCILPRIYYFVHIRNRLSFLA